jgi:hypothetical protein
MGGDVLVDRHTTKRIAQALPNCIRCDVAADISAREKPWPMRAFVPIIVPQHVQKGFGQHDVAVLAAFSVADLDDHPLAVNVLGAQTTGFRESKSSPIGAHQDGSMHRRLDGLEEHDDLGATENIRQGAGYLRSRDACEDLRTLEDDLVQELDGGVLSGHRGRTDLLCSVEQIGADLFLSHLLCGPHEVTDELLDGLQVDRTSTLA